MSVYTNIKRLREESNLTLEELGKRINTTRQTIQRYETGEISHIPYDKIVAMAKCFNVSPGYLMGWETETTVESATLDVALTNMGIRLKEYSLKLAELPKEKQELVMQMIDNLL